MAGEMNFVFGCAQLWNLYIQIPAYVLGSRCCCRSFIFLLMGAECVAKDRRAFIGKYVLVSLLMKFRHRQDKRKKIKFLLLRSEV